MPISSYVLRVFRNVDPANRGPVVDAVQEAGFTIENIQEDRRTPHKWGLFLKPSGTLSELFRLDREVLLWATTYREFQARDIERIKQIIDNRGVRLSRSFALLVTRYEPQARSKIEAEAGLEITIVHCSIRELSVRPEEGQEPALRRILLNRLYTRNLYDLPGATTRSADFFGRASALDDLADEVVQGQAQIGIFGLRKIGKTSLTNRLADVISQSGKCLISKIDLQWTTSIDPRPEYTLWSLGEALYASSRTVRKVKGFRLLGQYATASDALAQDLSVWEAFAHDLTALLRTTNRRIVFIVDEIERIFELQKSDFVRFWRFMRGFDQQFTSRLRFIVSGTSPECAEAATIDGEDNPLYQYLSVRYLGRLSADDSRELLTTLGGPIGLIWSDASLEYALQQTGGHPALLRTVGSIVHALATPRSEPRAIERPMVVAAAHHIVEAQTPILAQVTATLEDRYPDEFLMLEMLASGQVFNFRQLAAAFPDELSHLIGYGLLPSGSMSESLSIGLLQTYLQARTRRQTPRAGSVPSVAIGEYIGQRKVIASLKSGGFADVFLVEDEIGQPAAAKVFRGALLSSLERETEYLQALDHPGIVRFYDATQTLNGLPCLIMEYLDGRVLSDRCNSTAAPDTPELVDIALRLLDALAYMHPDVEGAAKLAAKAELTSHEFEAWERFRYGIVHRDVKPENILLTDRGPVLIDFNISVRAASPVVTVSATPGYLPPNFNGVSWTPDVDIYQLGVTLAQVAGGASFDGQNLEDLLLLAETRHGPAISKWLRLLVSDSRSPSAARLATQLRTIVRPPSIGR